MKKGLLLFTLIIFQISYSQTVTIPDVNFKAALIEQGVDTNGDSEIQVTEAEAVTDLNVRQKNIASLEGINSFINLTSLNCERNNLTGLNLSNLTNLTELNCNDNQITALNVSVLPNLTKLNCYRNQLSSLNVSSLSNLIELNCGRNNLTSLIVSGASNLEKIACDINQLTTLNLSNLPAIQELDCQSNEFTSLDVSNIPSLRILNCRFNEITSLDVSMLLSLEKLICHTNELTSLNVNGLSNLEELNCGLNNLTSLDLSGLTNLKRLLFNSNQVTTQNLINLENLTNLEYLRCSFNELTVLDISSLTNLREVYCGHNQLNSLDVSNLHNVFNFRCNSNQLTNLDISDLTSLEELYCGYNQLTSLDLSNQSNLDDLQCENNQLTTLDLSNTNKLRNLMLEDNHLEILLLKNDKNDSQVNFRLSGNSTLQYICTDPDERAFIQGVINSFNYPDCVVNSYCNFIPGGNPSYITGNVRLDLNANGCDSNDIGFGDLKLKITNSQNISDTFSTHADGSYNIALPEDSYTVEYVLENPSYFNVSPTSFTVNFPADTSPYQQDFCLTAIGVVQDLEIQIIPIELARPGFDADYKIIYKNNGTSTVSGNVTLTYDDNVMDLISSTPNFSSATQGFLSWAYTDLTPSETREILVTMNLNAPTETPPLNGGEILCYEAAITPTTNDQRVNDNTFTLKQTVVNSYDPNDKTCLEGNTVTPDLIGEYVHYLIRFENTGTASAINVVVKDAIDTAKFDISSLVIYDSSHDMVARIQNTNEVEFIFEGINLPFDDANNDGYIAFKIKTLPSLVVGDTFENTAEIYFDFNFPIITNTEQTTIDNTASVDDIFATANMRVFPNPVNALFTIESSVSFDSLAIYDLKGRQLQLINSTTPQLTKQIDLSNFANGIYYVSVQSGTAKKLLKVIRE